MRKYNILYLAVALFLLPLNGNAQTAVEQAINNFVSSPNNEYKIVSLDKTVNDDTLGGKHRFEYSCYSFTLKKKECKQIEALTNAFSKDVAAAYTVFTKPAMQSNDNTVIVDLDGFRSNIQFGTKNYKNYQVLFFRDKANPHYRWAYVLTYYNEAKNKIKGEIYRVYSIDPKKERSRQKRTIELYDFDGKTLNKLDFDSSAISSSMMTKRYKDLQANMQRMNKKMSLMGQQMSDLAKDPIENSEKMNKLGERMNILGDSMNVIGQEINEEAQKMTSDLEKMESIYGNKESLSAKLNKRFGSYYNMYRSGQIYYKSDSYLTTLANNIYELTQKKEALKDLPELKKTWIVGLQELAAKEKDKYRQRILYMAIDNLK
ncbi:MAG: hypothetical protein ACOYJF_03740 [Prevotella sp.]|jgi:hypothetical protein